MKLQAPNISDGYKISHAQSYNPKTTQVISNFTPRNFGYARHIPEFFDGKVVYFGLQYAIKEYLINQWNDTFFNKPKDEVINKYARRINNYLGRGKADSMIISMAALHDLGYLPLEIKSLPEGSKVNAGIPVFTIKNTHSDFPWITNYVETVLSATIWPMMNAASISEQYYKLSKHFGALTGASEEYWLPFANHNFSFRGMRGVEDGILSGAAHLLFSKGTDTLPSIDFLEDYYNADSDKELIGCSVNASEHATVTQAIALLGSEDAAFNHFITKLYPTGIFSYVSDSVDYWKLLSEIVPANKDVILARQPDHNGMPACITFRPDSSPKTPLEIICGDPDAEIDSPENLGTLQLLWNTFGGDEVLGSTGKKYRAIDGHVKIIYGEAISLEMARAIYTRMESLGWSVSNVLFGVGSWAFLEQSSRDSYGIAMKATHSTVDGLAVEMSKSPKTSSFKKSAKGLLRVTFDGDLSKFVLHDCQTANQEKQGLLERIFFNSKMIKETSVSEVRTRLGTN